MRAASKSQGVAKILVRPALWFCACNLLAAALAAQCSNPTQVSNQTISSGTYNFSDNNALSASSVVINGSASVTFVAGNCIQLLPGFHATAGTAGTTFHAWVETAPADVSVSPSSGSGLSQPFTWTVSSPSGYTNLSDVFALFNTSVSGANGCYIHYSRTSNLLYLADNTGANWLGGFVPGSSGSAGNSYCTIYGSGSSVSGSGTQLALTVSVTFQTSFAGTKNEYLIGYDNQGLNTTWQQMGTWTVSAPQQYYLTTAVSPSGAGTISPASGWYNSGSFVTITATPASGYHFNSFTGSINSSSSSITIQMNSSMTETANFAQNVTYYPLTTTVSPSGGGTVNPSCPGGCSYGGGSLVTITATPASGYQFNGFTGSINSGSNPLTVTLNSAMTETANFTPIATQYQLTTSVSPAGTGSISPATGLYNAGAMTITATPNSGYAFSNFSGTYVGITNPLSINLTGTGTITANFVPGYTISGQVTLSGSGSGVSGVSVSASGSQSGSTTTDANGRYSLPGLAAGGSYTVTASKSGYGLSAAQNFTNLASNQTASFTATPSLSINGGSNSAEVAPSTNVSMAFNLYDQGGANDIGWAQFYLADSSGNAYCYGDWGRPNGLDLYDGNTGATYGFGINQSDSFCTVSLASITNSPGDPTEVTVVLNFNFNPGTDGTYTVLTQINYGSGYAGPWQALGTLIIDPARETVLSPPIDEPAPGPAPAPTQQPPVPGYGNDCTDISGTWVSTADNRYTRTIDTSGGAVTPDSSATFTDTCGSITWQLTGSRQGNGTWQISFSNPSPSEGPCGHATSGSLIVTPACTTAQVSDSGGSTTNIQGNLVPVEAAEASTTTSWNRSSNPPGINLTLDLMAGRITTQLTGYKTSNLTVALDNSQGQQVLSTSHASAQSGNSFTDVFRMNPNLSVGQYGSVVATWDTASVTVPVAFYVVGNTRLTQYNTPYQQNCSANPQTAYVINKIDKAADGYCYWKKVQLGSQFVTQVIRNGTGVIGTNEIVKAYNAGARNVCHVPTGGTTNNSFFSVDTGGNPITKIKGSHNTVLSDATGTPNPFNNNNPGLPEATGSIAVLPNDPISPTAPAFPFVFGDQLLLIDQNDVNDALGPRSVVDYCPDCGPGSFAAPAVAHVDVFNSRQSCGTGSGYKNDAPFVTIRLR